MTINSKSLLYKNISDLTFISISNFEKLFETANQRLLKKGEIILKQGQVCNAIFFVEIGFLRTYIDNENGEINIDFTFEGNFTTNLKSLRSNTFSENNIQAGENAVIYEFDKIKLLELYKSSPQIESFGRNLLENLIISKENHTNLFKIYSLKERYHYLQINKPELFQRISLTQLASYLGVARETLSRIRKNKT
ncbi:MAG: Crp/Fnr family transcriptional regulator [Bacteroidia bacterium]